MWFGKGDVTWVKGKEIVGSWGGKLQRRRSMTAQFYGSWLAKIVEKRAKGSTVSVISFHTHITSTYNLHNTYYSIAPGENGGSVQSNILCSRLGHGGVIIYLCKAIFLIVDAHVNIIVIGLVVLTTNHPIWSSQYILLNHFQEKKIKCRQWISTRPDRVLRANDLVLNGVKFSIQT